MAVVEFNALSVALSGSFSATMIVPENADLPGDPSRAYPALYLFHDLGDDGTFVRKIKNLEALATRCGLFVIAPTVNHSFAMDLPYGAKYGKFAGEELPGICGHLFPLAEGRAMIGGVGWGAYGALTQYLSPAGSFQKCFVMNGRFDIPALYDEVLQGRSPHISQAMLEAVFGNAQGIPSSGFDLYAGKYPKDMQLLIGCEEYCATLEESARLCAGTGKEMLRGPTEESIMEQAVRWLVS